MKKKITLPDNLTPLYELSMNLWFSWNPEVRDLYREMDLPLWRKVGRNPTEFLKNLKQDKIDKFAADKTFLEKLGKTYDRFNDYMNNSNTIFSKNYPSLKNNYIAYFSAEYGLHESLPNYALRVTVDQRLAGAVTPMLENDPAPHFREHFGLERLVNAPEAVVGDVVDVFPELLVEQFVAPTAAAAHI